MTVGKNLLYGPLHRTVYDMASPEQVKREERGWGGRGREEREKRENECEYPVESGSLFIA